MGTLSSNIPATVVGAVTGKSLGRLRRAIILHFSSRFLFEQSSLIVGIYLFENHFIPYPATRHRIVTKVRCNLLS